MKNLHLMMFAAAGLLSNVGVASANVERITQSEMIPSPTKDLAQVSGTPARLRRQNEEQPGAEDTSFVMVDAKSGVYFSMSTELNGIGANHRMQLAAVPFTLKQNAEGAVVAEANLAAAKFITNNIGNEYRNANVPEGLAIEGAACVMYNYQPAGTNDTKRYMKCVDPVTLAEKMPQTLLMAKNNDDCSMHQDGVSTSLISKTAGKSRFIMYAGCNGNGRDDGWAQAFKVEGTAAGGLKLTREFDLSVEPQEERSRGLCSVSTTDPNTAICTWTAGNNQPQRNGTWIGAINVTEGAFNGANQQGALLWKMQLGGRKQVEGKTTYSMRASHQRIMQPDATGALVAGDLIAYRHGDLQGNNNTNGKGGTYRANTNAVMKVTKAGVEYVTPQKDLGGMLLGLDGTHIAMSHALFGEVGALKPGFIFHGGSHTGGGYASQARVVTWDAATGFKDGGSFGLAPHDRHLYPNYTGNNPGNQGRNHSTNRLIANPFAGQGGNRDAYLMLISTSGKTPELMTNPARKLSAFLSVMPVAQNQAPAAPPPPAPQPSGQDTNPTPPSGTDTSTGTDTAADSSDETLGGCSTGGSSSAGFLSLLLVGLAAFIRRRR